MKNIATFAIVLLAMFIHARAQSYDTVTGPNGRLPGYHYTEWFDTCDVYFDTKKHTIYYAANASEFDTDATDDVEYVITITAPIIPEVTTSSGYEVM